MQYPVGESDYTDDTKEILKQLKEKEEIVNISSDEEEDVDHDNEWRLIGKQHFMLVYILHVET